MPPQPHALAWPLAALLLVVRLVEIRVSGVHTRRLLERGGIRQRPDGFWPIVASQAILYAGIVLEPWLAPWARLGLHTWIALAFVAGANLLRAWCIATLGDHWTIRVVTVPGAALVRRGPYRFLRHPNYLAVAVEYVALCAAFSAWATLLVGTPVALGSLWYRIRREDAALGRARA